MRNELWAVLLSAGIGLTLGGGYFGGLWLTVRRMAETRRPTVWLIGSFAARAIAIMLVVLALLWAPWGNLLAFLIGLILARLIVGRFVAVAVRE